MILCICFNALFASVLYISLQRADIEIRQSYSLRHIQSMAKTLNAPSKPSIPSTFLNTTSNKTFFYPDSASIP